MGGKGAIRNVKNFLQMDQGVSKFSNPLQEGSKKIDCFKEVVHSIQSMLHLTLVLDGGLHFETATKFTLEIAAWLKSINKLTQLWPRWQPHQNHLSRVHKLRSSKKVNFWFTLTLIDNLLAVVRRNNLSWENFWCCDGLHLVHCPLHFLIPNWNWREKYMNKTQILWEFIPVSQGVMFLSARLTLASATLRSTTESMFSDQPGKEEISLEALILVNI